jgi:hypothetical protein
MNEKFTLAIDQSIINIIQKPAGWNTILKKFSKIFIKGSKPC